MKKRGVNDFSFVHLTLILLLYFMYICPCYTVKTVVNFFSPPFVAVGPSWLCVSLTMVYSTLQPLHSTLNYSWQRTSARKLLW